MATSQYIAPAFFKNMTEEQVLTWRIQTYSDVSKNFEFTDKEILSLQKTETMSLEDIKESIKKKMIMFQMRGYLKHLKSVFVMIDSCILGKYALPTILSKFTKSYNLDNKNIILVISNINRTENYYKIFNSKNYPGINFNILNYNLDLLEGKIKFKRQNIIIFETDIIFDNKVLFQEEKKILQKKKYWTSRDRNEINDNAQIELLIHLNNMFLKNCYFISRDLNMIDKINHISQHNHSIQVYKYM